MVNVADVVADVYSKLIDAVKNNAPECVFDALKVLKEEYLICKKNAASDCTPKQYVTRKGLEQATNHVIGYKLVGEANAQRECITISLDELANELANELGETSVPAVQALSKNIGSGLQEISVFKYDQELLYFNKAEEKIGIII